MTTFLAAPDDRRDARLTAPAVPAHVPAVHWQEVERGLWVAAAEGNFVGTVECVKGRFCARDAMGTVLDVFADAASARHRVAERYAQALPAADSWE